MRLLQTVVVVEAAADGGRGSPALASGLRTRMPRRIDRTMNSATAVCTNSVCHNVVCLSHNSCLLCGVGAECGTAVEQYSDEELGLCIIVLATFVHREPAAAAAMLPALLHNVSRYYNYNYKSTF